jgi:hypothetical protein
MALNNHVQRLHKKRSRRDFPQEPPRTQARTISTYFSAETMQALEAYISSLPEPKPARSKVISAGIREWLTSLGLLVSEADSTKQTGQIGEVKSPAGA